MIDAFQQITSKDLILVGIGSAITLILFLLRVVKDYVREYKIVTPLLGIWHTFHFSRANFRPVFRSEKWNIRRGLFGLNIETSDQERNGLNYHGRVIFDAAHNVLEFRGVGHSEVMQYRLTQPIPNEDTMMFGFHLSKDFDQEMYASCKVAFRNERSVEEAKDVILRGFVWIPEESGVRLSKEPIQKKGEPDSRANES